LRIGGTIYIRALLLFLVATALGSLRAQDVPLPVSSRDLYNDGTQKYRDGKLNEAESALQGAVSGQDDKVQDTALYNLGHVRYQQGVKQLKDGPDAKAAQSAANHAADRGDAANHAADDALAGTDVESLLAAYFQGRGARKELKQAIDALKLAIDSHGAVLSKWGRASGDFKSAHELQPADADSQHNADVVDKSIARLVDEQRMMMEAMAALQQKRDALKQKLGKMKQKLPGPDGKQMPGGNDDDDEDEDSPPQQPKEGSQEGPVKNGTEMVLTPEEAERLLGLLRLDSNRKLPLGATNTAQPRDHKHRDW